MAGESAKKQREKMIGSINMHSNIKMITCLVFLAQLASGQTDSTAAADSQQFQLSVPHPILNTLPNWNKAPQISIEHDKEAPAQPNFQFNFSMPDNPFEMDSRGSSYYVPREVHRQIEMGKGRDPDIIPIPYLYATYLALRLLDEYVLTPLSQSEQQQVSDFLDAGPDFELMRLLWKTGEQSLSEMYQREELRTAHSALELKQILSRLVINNLLEIRIIGSTEKYHPVLSRKKAIDLLERYIADQNNQDQNQRERVKGIHQALLVDSGALNFKSGK